MEKNNKQSKSIWGKWWTPIRKWFYPAWLIYEVTIRFYDYALAVHSYFMEQQNYLGEIGALILAVFCSVVTFIICTFYLTIPACFILYKFFKEDNLTKVRFEERIKRFF
ncbi:hypothetical protein [Flavivirga eckloniae]|uniref:Uncharacterized protein n=1 Tax=Flavivirga eckloniae TaxID=1803846 RepID=A0A2K9PUC9_9FLAO|nr:hypothetical protein [Flavivirga eckloniae]AUP80676.1 hypothetical protein C1H87_18940 [Flavivirga eckloniae]